MNQRRVFVCNVLILKNLTTSRNFGVEIAKFAYKFRKFRVRGTREKVRKLVHFEEKKLFIWCYSQRYLRIFGNKDAPMRDAFFHAILSEYTLTEPYLRITRGIVKIVSTARGNLRRFCSFSKFIIFEHQIYYIRIYYIITLRKFITKNWAPGTIDHASRH